MDRERKSVAFTIASLTRTANIPRMADGIYRALELNADNKPENRLYLYGVYLEKTPTVKSWVS